MWHIANAYRLAGASLLEMAARSPAGAAASSEEFRQEDDLVIVSVPVAKDTKPRSVDVKFGETTLEVGVVKSTGPPAEVLLKVRVSLRGGFGWC
jgi:hypothetical protein